MDFILFLILFYLSEYGVIKASSYFKYKGAFRKSIIDIASEGYKIDSVYLDAFYEFYDDKKFNFSFFKFLTGIYSVKSILELFNAFILDKYSSRIIDSYIDKRVLVPLTDDENNKVKSIKDKKDIIKYILNVSYNDDTLYLRHGKIFNRLFNIEQVKILNNIIGGDYSLFNCNGDNIAIIGMPVWDRNIINNISFSKGGFRTKISVNKIDYDKNMKFYVYPYFYNLDDVIKITTEVNRMISSNMDEISPRMDIDLKDDIKKLFKSNK